MNKELTLNQSLTTSQTDQPLTGAVVTRANGFMVYTPEFDRNQFERTAVAFAKAGMTFRLVMDAGSGLGYQVESGAADAGMLGGYRDRNWDMRNLGNSTVIWQNREEVISNTRQLASPVNSGQDLVTTSSALAASNNSEEVLQIIEGMVIVSIQGQVDANAALDGQITEPKIDPQLQAEQTAAIAQFITPKA